METPDDFVQDGSAERAEPRDSHLRVTFPSHWAHRGSRFNVMSMVGSCWASMERRRSMRLKPPRLGSASVSRHCRGNAEEKGVSPVGNVFRGHLPPRPPSPSALRLFSSSPLSTSASHWPFSLPINKLDERRTLSASTSADSYEHEPTSTGIGMKMENKTFSYVGQEEITS